MNPRGRWQGMLTILRFNWPFYLTAGVVLIAAMAAVASPIPTLWKLLGAGAAVGAGYFLFVSLGVSHWVYDRSDLSRFHWLNRALEGARRDRVLFCHSGFDDLSAMLRARLQPDHWLALDHFDPEQMTEASIRRARRICPLSAGTVSAPFDQWPVESSSVDLVFGLLAIHEFRPETERTRWFAQARRCLRPGGRVILAEHLRDPANFLAFGPGFLHFHSAASWRRCWEGAGFRTADEFRITPWIRVFVLLPP